jgi:hypothetical protein
VSISQPIIRSSVFTSGAGMSFSGPIMVMISMAKRRVSLSNSLTDMLLGSQQTPPLAPPKGMFTTAHFHVIHMASATISCKSTAGW